MFVDSKGHTILFSFDKNKGNLWSHPRYFGEFHHEDGTVACDGEFREIEEGEK